MTAKTTRAPRVGDVVHYVLSTGVHRPAIVVQPHSADLATLTIFSMPIEDTAGADRAPRDDITRMPGTWHWPEEN